MIVLAALPQDGLAFWLASEPKPQKGQQCSEAAHPAIRLASKYPASQQLRLLISCVFCLIVMQVLGAVQEQGSQPRFHLAMRGWCQRGDRFAKGTAHNAASHPHTHFTAKLMQVLGAVGGTTVWWWYSKAGRQKIDH